MAKQGYKKNKKKKKLPILDSDYDFLKFFSDESESKPFNHGKRSVLNFHDMVPDDILTDIPNDVSTERRSEPLHNEQEQVEDFETLLELSFKQRRLKKVSVRRQMPLEKRLKRYPSPEKNLDLHGLKALRARIRTESFILNCRSQGYFTVRVVVGKGLHSDCGPVLPDVIEELLEQLKKKGIILDFIWDRKKKSKSGAVIVYIRQ